MVRQGDSYDVDGKEYSRSNLSDSANSVVTWRDGIWNNSLLPAPQRGLGAPRPPS